MRSLMSSNDINIIFVLSIINHKIVVVIECWMEWVTSEYGMFVEGWIRVDLLIMVGFIGT